MSYTEYISFVKRHFPFWESVFSDHTPTPNLFCFQVLELPQSVLTSAQDFIKIAYKLRNNTKYQRHILGHDITQPHFSVLMSFDFHLTENGIKLIEINTNASHALTTTSLINYLAPHRNSFLNIEESIFNSFVLEHELYFNSKPHSILIADEDPKNQKAFFEFLMYKKLFEAHGISCEIADTKDLTYKDNHIIYQDKKFNFVYNRSTDFYLKSTPALQQAYIEHRACITPHPEEYKLLADKNRLLDFRDTQLISNFLSHEDIQHLHQVVPEIKHLTDKNFEELWSQKKNLFFKPANAYGGKAAYRGESVSKSKLQSVMAEMNYVAQEYIPAPEIERNIAGKAQKAKYDLRFYVYNGKIQLVAARLYQGQTTNFQTLGLGLSPVLFRS